MISIDKSQLENINSYLTIKIMKKALWFLMIILWFVALALLIVSLTDIYPNNPFQRHRLAIGCSFIVISEFNRRLYGKMYP